MNMVLSKRQIDIETVSRAVDLAQPLAEIEYIFTHEWLTEALALPPEPTTTAEFKPWEMRRMQLVQAWCDTLLSRYGIHVENARTVGYQVIDPRETAHLVARQVSRNTGKLIAQAFNKLTMTSVEGLTDADIAARHDVLAHLGKIDMMVRNARPKPPRPGKRLIEAD